MAGFGKSIIYETLCLTKRGFSRTKQSEKDIDIVTVGTYHGVQETRHVALGSPNNYGIGPLQL